MKQFIVSALIGCSITLAQSEQAEQALEARFMNFASLNGKAYDSVQKFHEAKQNFAKQERDVADLNRNNPSVTYALNEWSDLSDEEFIRQRTGVRGGSDDGQDSGDRRQLAEDVFDAGFGGSKWNTLVNDLDSIADKSQYFIDWVTEGKMTPVKNQGQCGSCWAFAGSSVMEGVYAVKNSAAPQRLSEQEMVDCSHYETSAYGCYGCEGCWPNWINKYAKEQGVGAYEAYPYTANDNACRSAGKPKVANFTQHGGISDSVSSVLNRLQKGPLMITLAVDTVIRNYSNGIIGVDGNGLNPPRQNHVVTLVGFGSEVVMLPEETKTITTGGETVTTLEYFRCRNNKNGSCPNQRPHEVDGQCCKAREVTTTTPITTETITVPAHEEEVFYWRLQNSWGQNWADNGFMRIRVAGGVGYTGMNRDVEWIEADLA